MDYIIYVFGITPPVVGVSTPASAVSGQYYMVLLTNYSNDPGTINFLQTGGTGSTDCNIVLGGDFTYFVGENYNANTNILNWKVIANNNISKFTIQRKTKNTDWLSIDVIHNDAENNLNNINSYSYEDHSFEKDINYYRIVQTNFDGKTNFSDIINIDNTIIPKKIEKIVNILGQEVDENQKGFVIIYYSDGSVVKTYK